MTCWKPEALGEDAFWRRLRTAGSSFQEILDDVRQRLAVRYLAEREKSLFEIAYLLGYSNTTAFVRAHKRWFGESPKRLDTS